MYGYDFPFEGSAKELGMLKFMSRWLLALAALSAIPAARGEDGIVGFWSGVHTGAHRNNEWPHPFIERDRQAAVAPFAVMIANGWQKQNLIGENYFDESTGALTLAGQERIHAILRQAPVEHRTLYVQRDLNEAVTNVRMDEVQRAVGALQPTGPLPDVLASDMVASGRAGGDRDRRTEGVRDIAPLAAAFGRQIEWRRRRKQQRRRRKWRRLRSLRRRLRRKLIAGPACASQSAA